MIEMTEQEFQAISAFIRQHYGINLEKKKYLIESKLRIELARVRAQNYSEYWQKLIADTDGTMKQRMLDQLTTNYSYFLREKKHFDFIDGTVIPGLKQRAGFTLRILCAGCASGQEAYTLAMYLTDDKQMGRLKIPFEIIGVDISEKEVLKAQKAVYGSDDYARIPERWRENYCTPFKEGQFAIRDKIKENVHFYKKNLMEPMYNCREIFQIVMCRNVLIYIQEPERSRIVKNIVDTLQPGGYLFVGHTEALMKDIEKLTYIQPAVYRKGGEVFCKK
ncbi:MAG: protein-glutamate O-methyltransferase CheR [Lachnospiraceae bacterium]|nr:protein-glutamate O-methyltransferase CheR [Lachnospiraceae bacterium]